MSKQHHQQPKASSEPAIMVTGGSGFIGQHVVRALADDGRTIVAVYHHKIPESRDNIYPVCADMSTPELMAAALRGVDTVVHLAWQGGLVGPTEAVHWDPADPKVLPKNAQVLYNLIKAMERAGTRRLVFLSAIGASPRATAPFLREKYLSEFLVLNAKIPEKVIIRSAVVWGGQTADDPFLKSIMRVMKYPIYPVPRKKDGISPLHVQDLADVIKTVVNQEMTEPASLVEIGGGEKYELGALFKLVQTHYVKKMQLAIPGVLGESMLPILERDRGDRTAKLKHFLALGGSSDDETRRQNPLADSLPAKFKSFKERLGPQA
jgi:NADH dehydrogenase